MQQCVEVVLQNYSDVFVRLDTGRSDECTAAECSSTNQSRLNRCITGIVSEAAAAAAAGDNVAALLPSPTSSLYIDFDHVSCLTSRRDLDKSAASMQVRMRMSDAMMIMMVN